MAIAIVLNYRMDLTGIAIAMGLLYQRAEEEDAQLRRWIVERKTRMRWGMLRRQAILSCLSHVCVLLIWLVFTLSIYVLILIYTLDCNG